MRKFNENDSNDIIKALVKLDSDRRIGQANCYVPMFSEREDAVIIASLIQSLQNNGFKDEKTFLNYCEVAMVLANVIMQKDKLDLSIFDKR